MLTVHVIIALAAIGIVAYRPARDASAALVAALAVLDVALGAPLLPALRSVAPVLAFLTAALALASAAERSGLVDRAAGTLARLAGGRSIVLFGLACGVCAVVTAVVSLDGAGVLMVPLLLTLARRYRRALRPAPAGHGGGGERRLDRGAPGKPHQPRADGTARPVAGGLPRAHAPARIGRRRRVRRGCRAPRAAGAGAPLSAVGSRRRRPLPDRTPRCRRSRLRGAGGLALAAHRTGALVAVRGRHRGGTRVASGSAPAARVPGSAGRAGDRPASGRGGVEPGRADPRGPRAGRPAARDRSGRGGLGSREQPAGERLRRRATRRRTIGLCRRSRARRRLARHAAGLCGHPARHRPRRPRRAPARRPAARAARRGRHAHRHGGAGRARRVSCNSARWSGPRALQSSAPATLPTRGAKQERARRRPRRPRVVRSRRRRRLCADAYFHGGSGTLERSQAIRPHGSPLVVSLPASARTARGARWSAPEGAKAVKVRSER